MAKLLLYTTYLLMGVMVLCVLITLLRYWALYSSPDDLLDEIITNENIRVDNKTVKKFKSDNFKFYRKLYISTLFHIKPNEPSPEEKFNLKNKMLLDFKMHLNNSKVNLDTENTGYQPIQAFKRNDAKGFLPYLFKKRILKISFFYAWPILLFFNLFTNQYQISLGSIICIIMIVFYVFYDFGTFLDKTDGKRQRK